MAGDRQNWHEEGKGREAVALVGRESAEGRV